MGEILGIARMKIREGKLAEFKRLSAKCEESVRTRDSGTLQYDVFLNDEQTEVLVVERYRDSEALAEHIANLGPLMQQMMEVCTAHGEMCGNPSPALRKAFQGGPVRVFVPHQSLTPERW